MFSAHIPQKCEVMNSLDYANYFIIYKGLSGKGPVIDNIREWFAQHCSNLAAEKSGLECACKNNDSLTVLVSEASRCC